jgi:diguanylate cyclase (GGDEF)-like protein
VSFGGKIDRDVRVVWWTSGFLVMFLAAVSPYMANAYHPVLDKPLPQWLMAISGTVWLFVGLLASVQQRIGRMTIPISLEPIVLVMLWAMLEPALLLVSVAVATLAYEAVRRRGDTLVTTYYVLLGISTKVAPWFFVATVAKLADITQDQMFWGLLPSTLLATFVRWILETIALTAALPHLSLVGNRRQVLIGQGYWLGALVAVWGLGMLISDGLWISPWHILTTLAVTCGAIGGTLRMQRLTDRAEQSHAIIEAIVAVTRDPDTVTQAAREALRSDYAELITIEGGHATRTASWIGEASLRSAIPVTQLPQAFQAVLTSKETARLHISRADTLAPHIIKHDHCIIVPMLGSHADQVLGLLIVASPHRSRGYRDPSVRLFATLGTHCSLFVSTEWQSKHDALTGIPNRAGFTAHVERELANNPTGTLMLIDLNNFKPVNDTHGHHAGDLVLIEHARRLSTLMEGTDIVARLGGDEFSIWTRRQPETLAAQITAALNNPVTITTTNGATIQVVVPGSLGVATAPHHGTQLKALLGLADQHMYAAKHQTRTKKATEPSPLPVYSSSKYSAHR